MDQASAGTDPNRSAEAPPYVFLSYNSEDGEAVVEIAEALRREGLEVWLDRWSMRAGDTWRNRLEQGLGCAAGCIVFLGPHGSGPWQDSEITLALQRQRDEARGERGFRLIPVLLPGTAPDDRLDFLDIYQAVTFRTADDREALARLVRGFRDAERQERPVPAPRGECPYKGLETFDIADAPRFFGRAAQIRELLDRLREPSESRFLAIVGSSGSGKSSLARAGVLAALQAGGPVILRPQSDPLRRLALALAPRFGYRDVDVDYLVGKMEREPAALRQAIDVGLAASPPEHRLPLLVDQLEEAFTLCADEARRRAFLDNLCDAGLHPESRAIVLVTLRSDFYGRCAEHPELRRAFSGHCLLGALGRDELREAVAEPARRAGWEVEEALLALLWDDFQRQPPGCLPLLQYALWEMWHRAPEPRLTADLYVEIGGIEGALERRADEVYARFSPGEREICRRVLLRLTEPREEKDFRLRLPLEHLLPPAGDPAPVAGVVEKLAGERLLTLDESEGGERVVEIAHEALLSSWKILRDWLDARRDERRAHARLSAAAREWARNGRSGDDLLVGGRLADAEAWAEERREELNRLEEDYLRDSVAARRRRQRSGIAAVVAIVGLAVAASFLAWRSWRGERLASARELALRAGQVVEQSPQKSLLLALEALRKAPWAQIPEAETILHQALAVDAGIWVGPWDERIQAATIRPDGIYLVTQDSSGLGGRVSRWSFEGRRQGNPIPLPSQGIIEQLEFSPGGEWLASKSGGESLRILRIASSSRQELDDTQQVTAIAFSGNGLLAAGDSQGRVRVWELQRASSQPRFICQQEDPILELEFDSRGDRLVANEGTFWQLAEDGSCQTASEFVHSAAPQWKVDLSKSPATLLFQSWRGWESVGVLRWQEHITGWKTGDHSLLTWGSTGPAQLWNLRQMDFTARSHPEVLSTGSRATLDPEGRWLATIDREGIARIWDLSASPPKSGPPLRCLLGTKFLSLSIGVDRRWLAGVDQVGTVCLWPLEGSRSGGESTGIRLSDSGRIAVGPERSWLAAAGSSLQVWRRGANGMYEPVPLPDRELGRVDSMTFGPLSNRLWMIAAWESGDVRMWDLAGRSPQERRTPRHRLGSPRASISLDGRWGMTTGDDGLAILRDLDHSGSPRVLPEEGVSAAAFSPTSRRLITGDATGAAILWSLPELTRQMVLRGHRGPLSALAFGGLDGRWLATGSEDETVRVWDLAADTPETTSVVLRLPHPPEALAFTPDGRRLVSVASGQVSIWRLDPGSLARLACEKLGRNAGRREWRELTGRDEEPPETCPGLPHPPDPEDLEVEPLL